MSIKYPSIELYKESIKAKYVSENGFFITKNGIILYRDRNSTWYQMTSFNSWKQNNSWMGRYYDAASEIVPIPDELLVKYDISRTLNISKRMDTPKRDGYIRIGTKGGGYSWNELYYYPQNKIFISDQWSTGSVDCDDRYHGFEIISKDYIVKHLNEIYNRNNEFLDKLAKTEEKNMICKSCGNEISQVSGSAKTKNSDKKSVIIIIAVFIIISALFVITHIHKCEKCEKIYFGNKYEISFWGQSEEAYKDFYNNFYSW